MLRPFRSILPTVDPSAFVDNSAQVIGDVHVGAESSIWMNVVVRGDVNSIRIGARTNLQDLVLVHVMRETNPTVIGDNVTVGHSAVVHGCTIEDRCLIGMGAILLNGCRIGTGSIVAAGALIPEGVVVPPGSMVMGIPGKVRRALTSEEDASIKWYADNYVRYRLDFQSEHTLSSGKRTEPARGMRDFLPEDVRRREYIIGIIKRVYERYGFEPLETPAVENLDTLLGKYGDEGNKLIFKILKRGEHEKTGEADLALRYDLTVPLARVVAEHQARLPRLFKRYQIQPVWRADRPARGRFREFFQCDVDSLGSTSSTIEAELCAAVADAMTELGFTEFQIRFNHRQLLSSVLKRAGFPAEREGETLVVLDKLDKIGEDGVVKEWVAKGLGDEAGLANAAKTLRTGLATLDGAARFIDGDAVGQAAVENLQRVIELSRGTSAGPRLTFDGTLARGLSYYTGAIMEVNVADLAGSLGGGGRYDNLVGMFSGQDIPACGFSLGLERILVVMTERGMFPPTLATSPADVMLATFDASAAADAMRVAETLRASGLRVLVYPDADKIGKQIEYADGRGIPFVALLGDDEIKAGTVTVKNLAAQTQQTYPQAAAAAAIREALTQRG